MKMTTPFDIKMVEFGQDVLINCCKEVSSQSKISIQHILVHASATILWQTKDQGREQWVGNITKGRQQLFWQTKDQGREQCVGNITIGRQPLFWQTKDQGREQWVSNITKGRQHLYVI